MYSAKYTLTFLSLCLGCGQSTNCAVKHFFVIHCDIAWPPCEIFSNPFFKMSWMDVGVIGTSKIGGIKTTLKGARQKNTLAMTNLKRQIGIFLEMVHDADPSKQSKLITNKLEGVLKAQKIVESTYDVITENVATLTAELSEMQNHPDLNEKHVEELKKDILDQETKHEKRGDEYARLMGESNKLLVEWEYNPPDLPSLPHTMAFPPPRIRFKDVESFKPKPPLSIEASYEDFLDFRHRFEIYAKRCYESVPIVDGALGITYEEWSSLLLTCVEPGWTKRIKFDDFVDINALLEKFDSEIQLLQPLHLRRITLIKIQSSKGEKASMLMRRLLEASKVADLPNLSPEALILHLFLDKCIESEENKDIKNRAVEILRTKSAKGTKVEQKDIDLFVTYSKEMESSVISRTGKPSKALRAEQRGCPICKGDHTRFKCTLKCIHCGRTGHSKENCWQLPENAHKKPANNKPPTPASSKTSPPTKSGSSKPSGSGKNSKPVGSQKNKSLKTEEDPEDRSSDLDSAAEHSNRLTDIGSKAMRLAKFDPRQMLMGDGPSESSGTPFYLGTVSKTWADDGKLLEVKGIPDTGCTQDTLPIQVARDHGLKIKETDYDEPGMEAYGGTRVEIVGQVSFYYKPRKFHTKKLVKALVANIPGRDILFSWQTLLRWGVIDSNFPYLPGQTTDDSDSVEPLTPNEQVDDNVSRLDSFCATDVATTDSVEKCCTTSSVEPDFQSVRKSLLKEYEDVFKENLSPQDRMRGVKRIEIKDPDAKPLHFNTPKEVPAHLRRAANKELKRCLEAGQLEPCHHFTKWLSRGMFVAKPSKPGESVKARLVSDFRILNKNLKSPITHWKGPVNS